MKNATKMAQLAVEDMSASQVAKFFKWMQTRMPEEVEVEAKTSNLKSAAKWWLAKLKSGNVLPDVGWPSTLPINDLTQDYINVVKFKMSLRGNATSMGRFLQTVGAVEKNKSSRKTEVTIRAGEPGGEGLQAGTEVIRTRRVRYYVLHGLDDCRAGFEAAHGPQDWTDSDGYVDGAQEADGQCPNGE